MPNIVEKALSSFGKKSNPADKNDPIPAGMTNLAIVTTLVAGISIIAESITGWFTLFLGDQPTPTTQAAFSIAVIAALALVLSADVLSRAYASAGRRVGGVGTVSAISGAAPTVSGATASENLLVGIVVSIPSFEAKAETGWLVLKVTNEKVLVVKKGERPAWHLLEDVRGE